MERDDEVRQAIAVEKKPSTLFYALVAVAMLLFVVGYYVLFPAHPAGSPATTVETRVTSGKQADAMSARLDESIRNASSSFSELGGILEPK